MRSFVTIVVVIVLGWLAYNFTISNMQLVQRAQYGDCVRIATYKSFAMNMTGANIKPELFPTFWNEASKCGSILTPPFHVPVVIFPQSATGSNNASGRR